MMSLPSQLPWHIPLEKRSTHAATSQPKLSAVLLSELSSKDG